MKILAIFYVVATFMDWIMFLTGKVTMSNDDLLCYKHHIIIVNSNLGGTYMFAFSLISYLYAFFMWYAFYQVPKKFGGVASRSVDDVAMLLVDESAIV